MEGFITLTVVVLVCGTKGVDVREWYVPFYGPHSSAFSQYRYSFSPLLPSSYSNQMNTAKGFSPPNQVQYAATPVVLTPAQFVAPKAGLIGGAPLGNGALQSGYVTGQTGNGLAPTGTGALQNGYGAVQPGSGPVSTVIVTGTAQLGNGLGQSGNTTLQSGSGAAQNRNGATQTGNSGGQPGGPSTGVAGGTQSNIWAGYTMYAASEYPALLQKVSAALQANGPELTAAQINFGGHKTVGSESKTGPGTISLVNFGTNANKNCYAYLVEPTGKTPLIPKGSIACAA